MKKKLAFVDYWHHEHTRSGDFLRNIFSEKVLSIFSIFERSKRFKASSIINWFDLKVVKELWIRLTKGKIFWAPNASAAKIVRFVASSLLFWLKINIKIAKHISAIYSKYIRGDSCTFLLNVRLFAIWYENLLNFEIKILCKE